MLGGRADLLNPSTNTWTQLPPGPIDDVNPGVFVWTGSSVIDFNTSIETNGPGGKYVAGPSGRMGSQHRRVDATPCCAVVRR